MTPQQKVKKLKESFAIGIGRIWTRGAESKFCQSVIAFDIDELGGEFSEFSEVCFYCGKWFIYDTRGQQYNWCSLSADELAQITEYIINKYL